MAQANVGERNAMQAGLDGRSTFGSGIGYDSLELASPADGHWTRAALLDLSSKEQEVQVSIFGSILAKLGLGGSGAATAATASSDAVAPAAQAGGQTVDVEAVLTAMPGSSNLNWRTSIVDLMKLLGMDSSLSNRKELAAELGYSGDTNDSATMNIWLQKQVMQNLAANGGKVPENLKA